MVASVNEPMKTLAPEQCARDQNPRLVADDDEPDFRELLTTAFARLGSFFGKLPESPQRP